MNNPALPEPSDAQLSFELSLLKKAFPTDDCSSCQFFTESEHPTSGMETECRCEVLHGDIDQDECIALPELILDAQRAMDDDYESDVAWGRA